jgi:hypothetical protein
MGPKEAAMATHISTLKTQVNGEQRLHHCGAKTI